MRRKILFIGLALVCTVSLFAQQKEEIKTIEINAERFITKAPSELIELSGLLIYQDKFWGFNDSGGTNTIFAFDNKGKITQTVILKGAENIDWESITQDKKHIYIGDFGNNNGYRKDLCIYKINKKNLTNKKQQKIDCKKIRINYSNQAKFSFPHKSTPFDCEAMIAKSGKLFLFSKNWRDKTTWLYKLPKKRGKYPIAPIDTFDVKGLITGAELNQDQTKLALIGYENYKPFIWIFYDFSRCRFFDGKKIRIDLPNIKDAQTEGISFLNDSTLLISCEQTDAFPQQVFKIDLKGI